MNTSETHDYEAILGIVRQWPHEERIAFIQEVLQTLIARDRTAPQKPATLSQALGIAHVAMPPNDTEVGQWLAEHRQEKYG